MKEKFSNQPPPFGSGCCDTAEVKTVKCSTIDLENGQFRIGECKHVFAYAVETACDKSGCILGYTVNPCNQNVSRSFKGIYDKIKRIGIKTLVADAYYDCGICPNNKVMKYSTTNRDGYREYKSSGVVCSFCPYLSQYNRFVDENGIPKGL